MIYRHLTGFDADRNWQTRLEAERATRARNMARHERNLRLAAFWSEVLGAVILGTVFVVGIREAINAGLFSWLTNFGQ